jgi:imidazolonepropionase
VVQDAAVVWRQGRVVYVGPDAGAPSAQEEVDGSLWVGLPGLVDCHTHAVWAGSRADEFRRRLAGEPYSKILEEGGGILSTVRATRATSYEDLVTTAAARLRASLERGVTLIEVKSGYGLDADHEVRCLRAAREAGRQADIGVRTTFLGAHAIPLEFRGRREAYVRDIVEQQLPKVVAWADAIDAYVDRGAFTVEEGREILEAGRRAGLRVRVHAEQVEWTGAAEMAASLGAISADHLERLDEAGARAMAAAGTLAVLLPAAMLYLRDVPPPTAMLRAYGVPMAVATDLNPGSSPTSDLWACATLACLTMGLTAEEVLLGMTREAARAMGAPDHGRVYVGGPADLSFFRVPAGEPVHEDVLVQRMEGHRAALVVREGRFRRFLSPWSEPHRPR